MALLELLASKLDDVRDPILSALMAIAICLYPLVGWYQTLQTRLTQFDHKWMTIEHSIEQQRLQLTADCHAYSDGNAKDVKAKIDLINRELATLRGTVHAFHSTSGGYDFNSRRASP